MRCSIRCGTGSVPRSPTRGPIGCSRARRGSTKYLREVDRAGATHTDAELDDLAQLLGSRPSSIAEGAADLADLVSTGEVTALDLLPYAAGQVARRTQLVGPAMGVLATRHLPAL